MTKFEVGQKGYCLAHTHVTIHFEADVGEGAPGKYVPHNVLGNNVQARGLEERGETN